MKTVIAFFLSLVAFTNAFTTTSPLTVGKALPRLSEQSSTFQSSQQLTTQQQQLTRDDKLVVLNNALREFANWNDVWDGDGGYGGYGMGGGGGMGGGMGMGVYSRRRGGYGG